MKKPAIALGLLALVLSVFLAGCGKVDMTKIICYYNENSTLGSQSADPGQFQAAVRFDQPAIGFLAGRYITEIVLKTPGSCTITSCKVLIWNGGSSGPGESLQEETHALSPGLNLIELEKPYPLSVGTDIFVGVSMTNSTDQTVGALSYDSETNKAGYNYRCDSTNTWSVFPHNWCIHLIVRPK